jgi:hypothetical protein
LNEIEREENAMSALTGFPLRLAAEAKAVIEQNRLHEAVERMTEEAARLFPYALGGEILLRIDPEIEHSWLVWEIQIPADHSEQAATQWRAWDNAWLVAYPPPRQFSFSVEFQTVRS